MRRVFLLGAIMLLAFTSAASSEEAVHACGDFLYEMLEDGTVGIVGYNGNDAHLVIPAELDGKKVSVIGATNLTNRWKYNIDCDDVVSIEIEEGIEDLMPSTLYCRNLETIYLPASLNCEMRGWSRMNPFINCDDLKEIKVAKNHPVLEIRNGALIDKSRNELIAYPKQSKEKKIIPDGVRRIGAFAYEFIEGMDGISIPDGVEEVARYAFAFTDVKRIYLPETLKKLEGGAFKGCRELTYVYIPKNVNLEIQSPFTTCVSLTEIDVAEDHPELFKINGMVISKESQQLICVEAGHKDYVIPDEVKSIADEVFEGMTVRTIKVSKGVETIGRAAFEGAYGLKSITLPVSVKQIGENAFTYWSPEAAKELDLICYVSNEYAAQYCEAAGIKYEWAE